MNGLIQTRWTLSWLLTSLFLLLFICNKIDLHSQPMTVVLIANWNDKSCGVAEHSRHFARTLEKKGVTVVKLDSLKSFYR